MRRIEAVTGAAALAWIDTGEQQLASVAALVKGPRTQVAEKVGQLVDQTKRMQKELDALRTKLAASQGADLAAGAVDVNGINVLAAAVEGDPKSLPATMDNLRERLGNAVVVLAHRGPKVRLVTGVSKSVTDRVSASDVVRLSRCASGRQGWRARRHGAGGRRRPPGTAHRSARRSRGLGARTHCGVGTKRSRPGGPEKTAATQKNNAALRQSWRS